MFQNFKTDIIYYNTLTDFELEFNLCGCCGRMRLLNDKCSDKKTLLLSLSRAVSRSRVVIVTAPIFNGENIIGTIASAIGKETETINNNEFNIASEQEISIIKGSLPLVTPDGIFGGCIIESGPQSLIILTDNKPVRKALMKTLIHPYIEEIHTMETSSETEEPMSEELPGEETNEDTNEIITEEPEEEMPDSDNEEIEKTDTEPDGEQTEFVLESEPDDSPDYYAEEFEDLYTEVTPKKRKNDVEDEDDDYYYDGDYFTEESPKKKSPILSRWMLIISIIVLLAIAVLCFSIFYVPSTEGVSPANYVKDVFNTLFG